MNYDLYLWLIVGAAAGGFINGLAGFGTGLFTLGFWLLVFPPVQAVAIVLAMSVASGVQGVLLVRNSILPWRLGRFLIPALFGVPIGLHLLKMLDASALKLTIAAFLILYGGFFLLRNDLPRFERKTPIADGMIGFAGGVLGGAAGLSGPLPTMWCALRAWTKSEQRAVLQPFNVVVLSIAIALFAIDGAYTRQTLLLVGLAFPVNMIFARIGISVFKRLTDDQFRRLLIGLLFVSGIIQLWRAVL